MALTDMTVEAARSPTGLAAEVALQKRRQSLVITSAVAVLVGVAATWYGFLDDSDGSHPTLKLGGAMAIACLGPGLPVLGRPLTPPDQRWSGRDHSALFEVNPLTLGLAWLSVGAAVIHFAVIDQHFNEFKLYGWFFIVVAVGELVWAGLAVATPSRLLFVAGAVGNALVVVAWIVTRSYGSLVGPEATDAADVGFGDLVSTVFEIVIVVGCIVLVFSARSRRRVPTYWSEVGSLVVALGVTLFTVLALYSAVGGEPFVSHVG